MVASIGRMAPLALALLGIAIPASVARAQGNSFNPYGNSGYADYREFGNPAYSNSPSLPGQARLNAEPTITRPRANSFQQYSDTLDGRQADPVAGSSASRASTTNLPYYQAYRQLDKEYGRVYRPNADADEGFDDRLKRRDQAYAKALREPDPAKRTKMLRQIELDSLDRPPTARSTRGTGSAARGGSAGPAPAPPSSVRPPNPYRNPSARRAPAPLAPPPTPRTSPPSTRRAPAAPGRPSAPAREARPVPPPDPSTIAVPPPI